MKKIKPPTLEEVRIYQQPDTVPDGWFNAHELQKEWGLCDSQTRRLIQSAIKAGRATVRKFKIDHGGHTLRATAHYQFKS